MKQQIVHDQSVYAYSHQLDCIWAGWEPWLRESERMLYAGPEAIDDEECPELLRRAQYHAHTAAEFTAGLDVPMHAFEAHDYLVRSLSTARDALSVLAVHAEMNDLDMRTTELGLRAVSGSRDAFRTALGVAQSGGAVSIRQMPAVPQQRRVDPLSVAIWSLGAVCLVLLVTLGIELFVVN